MDGKTKDALKQLQAEIRQLQTAIASIKPGSVGELFDHDHDGDVDSTGAHKEAIGPVGQAAVQYSIHYTTEQNGETTTQTAANSMSLAQLSKVGDEAVAAIGYALSSAQKVGLLRSLLGKSSESASALGEATGLSTGSLYHHLRDLMHADLITQSARNRYVLTERGLRVLLVLSALAG